MAVALTVRLSGKQMGVGKTFITDTVDVFLASSLEQQGLTVLFAARQLVQTFEMVRSSLPKTRKYKSPWGNLESGLRCPYCSAGDAGRLDSLWPEPIHLWAI